MTNPEPKNTVISSFKLSLLIGILAMAVFSGAFAGGKVVGNGGDENALQFRNAAQGVVLNPVRV